MSCPKMSALLSQHWRHSAHCDCLGSCWRVNSLNEDCQHARKRFWHCLVPLSTRSAQVSVLSLALDSSLSKKRSGKKKFLKLQCRVRLFMIVRCWGQCWWFWTELMSVTRRPPNWVHEFLWCQDEKTHAHSMADLTHCQTIMIMKLWTEWSTLGKRWDTALGGFSWESLWTVQASPLPLQQLTWFIDKEGLKISSISLAKSGSAHDAGLHLAWIIDPV